MLLKSVLSSPQNKLVYLPNKCLIAAKTFILISFLLGQ
ncbi:MAG: Uncharacterised protein [Opitutia bacterium UBA7350]|nr:MAG: Uncharacterised protein [Opitutae bacterium UBA7350]